MSRIFWNCPWILFTVVGLKVIWWPYTADGLQSYHANNYKLSLKLWNYLITHDFVRVCYRKLIFYSNLCIGVCRNNKLTMLMQDSLGGNAKTLMFVNISPADYNADETVTSLTYVLCNFTTQSYHPLKLHCFLYIMLTMWLLGSYLANSSSIVITQYAASAYSRGR